MLNDRIWWKHGVIYQIYPRSFCDSNGDGVGDIPGIIEKLDYLTDLGIEAIWLSPINTSPMYDFGYDISDYRNIDPLFGTNDDFDRLLKEAHSRDIRIIMDLVLNHTSFMHPWFQESMSSKVNPKRNWYIWRDEKNGKPPNNWMSAFGGSAWEWDEQTGQYYLHSFLREQPDVNWRNEELRNAMLNEIRYWLDKGIDGFRLDVANCFVKDRHFRNNPRSLRPHQLQKHRYDRNRPETLEIMRELRSLVNEYKNRMLVGEVLSLPPGNPELSARYLGSGEDALQLAFDFSLMYRWWSARSIYKSIKKWMSLIPEKGWPCHVLSNHDHPRSISRFGGGGPDADKRARVAIIMLLTLRGTPFLYYGEEIGMKNCKIPRRLIADPLGKYYWPFFSGRDPARTPMQWNTSPNAGFSTGRTWLPVNSEYKKVNVKSQLNDSYSLLNLYKSLIRIRKEKYVLQEGDWRPVIKGRKGIIAYSRNLKGSKIYVILNFTKKQQRVHIDDRAQWKVLISTHKFCNEHFTNVAFKLFPYEATVIEKIGSLDPKEGGIIDT